MSTEGAWDLANESHSHGDNYAQQSDVDDQADTDPNPLPDGDENQCGHLCHGHMSTVATNLAHFGLVQSDGYFAFRSTLFSSRSQAPPTPPPNA